MAPEGGGAATSATPKVLLVVVSILADFLMSGITYGYSGLVPVLTMDTKAFASTCEPGEDMPCIGQIRALTAAFTLSVSTVSASGVPVGLVLDAVGPRHTSILGALIFALGLVAFAVAPIFSDFLYYAGFFLLSLGGPAMITATMNFADLFPSMASAIISAQNGAFDASSCVMFLMGKTATAFGISLAAVMLSYLSVPLTLIVIAALLFPDTPFGMSSDDSKAEEEPPADASPSSSSPSLAPAEASDGGGENLTPSPSQPTSGQKGELWRLYYLRLEALRSAGGAPPAGPAPAGSGSEGALTEPLLGAAGGQAVHAVPSTDFELLAPPPDLYNTDIMQQMKSTVFWVLVLVSSYLVTRSNFYIASIYQQLYFAVLNHSAHPLSPGEATEYAEVYVDVFNYIMPIGGALSVPLSGAAMVRFGMTTTFSIIGAMCCIVSALQALATVLPLYFQVVGFVVFAVLRAFIFGAIAAFMGIIFGFRNFGRLFGISRVAGAVVTTIQYPLIHLAEHQLDGDYRPIDVAFLALELLLMIGFPLYLWKGVFFNYFFIPDDSHAVQRVRSEELAAGEPEIP